MRSQGRNFLIVSVVYFSVSTLIYVFFPFKITSYFFVGPRNAQNFLEYLTHHADGDQFETQPQYRGGLRVSFISDSRQNAQETYQKISNDFKKSPLYDSSPAVILQAIDKKIIVEYLEFLQKDRDCYNMYLATEEQIKLLAASFVFRSAKIDEAKGTFGEIKNIYDGIRCASDKHSQIFKILIESQISNMIRNDYEIWQKDQDELSPFIIGNMRPGRLNFVIQILSLYITLAFLFIIGNALRLR